MSKRWLLFEVLNEEEIEKKHLALKIKHNLYTSFGTFINLKVDFWLHKFTQHTGILEVHRQGLQVIRTILTLLHHLNDEKILVNDLLVSGTLKKLREKSEKILTWREEQESLKETLATVEEVKGENGELFPIFKRMQRKLSNL